ncbi:hypothetical protein [Klebsiella phage vB_KpnS_Uniso31]|uniref:Uncharacterized protein n=1 Tax=Klebsiella phage vB_KpnS_Uniso31 TaxID=2951200 RepID=A0A9E7NGJ6_9CAUD|nr:hypothetical protein [Klebsiella phage vB_KpnS_Uniso31]
MKFNELSTRQMIIFMKTRNNACVYFMLYSRLFGKLSTAQNNLTS